MDAMMAALVAALVIHGTDRTPWLAADLAARRAPAALLLGFVTGLGAVNALAVAGGMLVAPHLTPNASALFLAFALGAAAIGNFTKLSAPDDLSAWRTGAFATALVSALALGFGAAQFVVAGIVARTPLPVFAAIGATLGGSVAAGVGVVGGRRAARRLRQPAVRIATGIALMIAAAIAALSALRLV